MTPQRIEDIRFDNDFAKSRVKVLKASTSHELSWKTVDSSCQVIDELLAEVTRLRKEIKKHKDVPGVAMLGRDLELYKALEEK